MSFSAEWAAAFRRCFGPTLPLSYIAADTETTGFAADALVTEIGYVVVRDGIAVDRGSYVLNWALRPDIVEDAWMKFTLEKQAAQLAEINIFTVPSYERVTREGLCPDRVMRFFDTLIRNNAEAGGCLVGHNFSRFDWPKLTYGWGLLDIEPPELGSIYYDTGGLAKSVKLQQKPTGGYSLLEWQEKIINTRAKGVKWSLKDCLQEFGVLDKHDLNLDELHGAGADTYATHLLFEAFRDLIEVGDSQ